MWQTHAKVSPAKSRIMMTRLPLALNFQGHIANQAGSVKVGSSSLVSLFLLVPTSSTKMSLAGGVAVGVGVGVCACADKTVTATKPRNSAAFWLKRRVLLIMRFV